LMDRMTWREEAFNKAGIWPTVVIGNHDLPRAASRYCRGENDEQAKLAMALLLTQRGTPFLYYGEEIGMRDISLKRSEILDPAGKNFWPIYKGRDGCRSPMQWNENAHAGFSEVSPWLPVHPDYTSRNVASQQNDPDSILTFTKKLLHLRKTTPALTRGDFIPFQSPPGTLSYLRQAEDQRILVMLNFKKRRVSIALPPGEWHLIFSSSEGGSGKLGPFEIQLYIQG
jgi:alpha-glucosidase